MVKTQQPDNDPGREEQYAHGYSSILTQQFHAGRTAASHAAFFLPFLRSGMTLLDCGCGSGGITLGLAGACAPGKVVGIDIGVSEIDRAVANATERGCSNVRFEVAHLYDLPFSDSTFDAVFSHAVLEHLKAPSDALNEMHRVLKPGGIIGIRDVDWGSYVYSPSDPLIEQGVALIEENWNSTSGNSRMARNLRVLLNQAQFVEVAASAHAESWGTSESTKAFGQMMAIRLEEPDFVGSATSRGLIEESKLKQLSNAWRRWGNDPTSFLAVTWCEVVGWKE